MIYHKTTLSLSRRSCPLGALKGLSNLQHPVIDDDTSATNVRATHVGKLLMDTGKAYKRFSTMLVLPVISGNPEEVNGKSHFSFPGYYCRIYNKFSGTTLKCKLETTILNNSLVVFNISWISKGNQIYTPFISFFYFSIYRVTQKYWKIL